MIQQSDYDQSYLALVISTCDRQGKNEWVPIQACSRDLSLGLRAGTAGRLRRPVGTYYEQKFQIDPMQTTVFIIGKLHSTSGTPLNDVDSAGGRTQRCRAR